MKGKLLFSVLMAALIFFAASICIAAQGKNKDSANTNKQSLETSTRGKERAEQRHEVKGNGESGKEGDESIGDDDDEEKKWKKKQKVEKNRDGNDYDDDGKEKRNKKQEKKGGKSKNDNDDKGDDSDDNKGSSSDEESPKETKSRRWWEFNKKSGE